MESFIAVGIIVTVIGIIGYGVWIAANSLRPQQKEEEEIWQQLAKSHQLNFTPSGNLPDTFVSGMYRGYFLLLRTLEDDTTGQMQTQVSLKRRQPVDEQFNQQLLNNFIELAEAQPLKGWLGAESEGVSLFYQQSGVETDKAYLRSIFSLLNNLMTIYPQIIKLGGEALPTVQETGQRFESFRPFCTQLIEDIAQETAIRLKERVAELWCPTCLTQFKMLEIKLSQMEKEVYYGCRTCGQSREVLQLPKGVVVILDNQQLEERNEHAGLLKVNWLSRRELFDFDGVEIIQATDEEVERFAVQIGNDTDGWRQSRYKEMKCVIAQSCEITTNTERILQSMFGQVVRYSGS